MLPGFAALDLEELIKLEHFPGAARPALGSLVKDGLTRVELALSVQISIKEVVASLALASHPRHNSKPRWVVSERVLLFLLRVALRSHRPGLFCSLSTHFLNSGCRWGLGRRGAVDLHITSRHEIDIVVGFRGGRERRRLCRLLIRVDSYLNCPPTQVTLLKWPAN